MFTARTLLSWIIRIVLFIVLVWLVIWLLRMVF